MSSTNEKVLVLRQRGEFLLPAVEEYGPTFSPSSYPFALLLSVLLSLSGAPVCITLCIMDLVSWSINSIDKIFSSFRTSKGAPTCPDSTHLAGYVMDSWGEWKIMCLALLSIEDAEDVYLIGIMGTGFLLIGACGDPGYHKLLEKTGPDGKLPALTDKVCRAGGTQTLALQDLNHKIEDLSRLVHNLERSLAQVDGH